jgi:hypothetical protein
MVGVPRGAELCRGRPAPQPCPSSAPVCGTVHVYMGHTPSQRRRGRRCSRRGAALTSSATSLAAHPTSACSGRSATYECRGNTTCILPLAVGVTVTGSAWWLGGATPRWLSHLKWPRSESPDNAVGCCWVPMHRTDAVVVGSGRERVWRARRLPHRLPPGSADCRRFTEKSIVRPPPAPPAPPQLHPVT